MKSEHEIQNEIRAALAKECMIFRMNVGGLYTADGRFVRTGVPPGFSDLFGFRKRDGKAVFIEVKTPNGRLSEKQRHFLKVMCECGAIAGVARSVQDALALIHEK